MVFADPLPVQGLAPRGKSWGKRSYPGEDRNAPIGKGWFGTDFAVPQGYVAQRSRRRLSDAC